ncbi:major facilitator superfamily domain-containing protein [Hyaloscypha finlandica]|nr:major facilitator superfamily domain-containing protein [Hyaloscypha finlandica]
MLTSTQFILVGPMLPLLQPRVLSLVHTNTPSETSFDTTVFTNPLFYSASLSNIFQGLAFFLPFIYLPTYAHDIGLNNAKSTLALSFLNISQIIGQIGIGYLSDHHSIYIPLFLSPFFSALCTFLLWGFAKSFAPLIIFSILYGIFSGGYSVLYCRFATSLTSTEELRGVEGRGSGVERGNQRATGLWLYSIFDFQRGVGNIVGGVVSGALVKGRVVEVSYGAGKYEWLVVLVGGSLFVSCLGGSGWFVKDRRLTLRWRRGKEGKPKAVG